MATPRKANPQKPSTTKASAVSAAARAKGSALREALVSSTGSTPLDVMLKAMRRLERDADAARTQGQARTLLRAAADVAKDAAPYVHPKLATVTHQGGDKPIEIGVTVYVPKKAEPRNG